MSFEGNYQILCKNGHLSEVDCYEHPKFREDDDDMYGMSKMWKCPECREFAAWWNLVDVTNGSYCACNKDCLDRSEGCEECDRGRIDCYVDLEVEKRAEYVVCVCCGESKLTSKTTYKIPTDKRHKV